MEIPLFARIAPRDELVAILNTEGTTECVYDIDANVVAGRSGLSNVLHALETAIVPVCDVNEAVGVLRLRSDMTACLDMVLMLFDDRISLKTRTRLALTLNGLLAEVPIRNYVQDILYARPLPDMANFNAAKSAAKSIAGTSQFICQLISKQVVIQQIHDAWLTAMSEQRIERNEQDRTLAYLSGNGFFRRVVLEVWENNDVDRIWREIMNHPEFEQQRIDVFNLKEFVERVDQIVPEIIKSNPLSIFEERFVRILARHFSGARISSLDEAFVQQLRVFAEAVQIELPGSMMHYVLFGQLLCAFSRMQAFIQDSNGFLKELCEWAGLSITHFSEADMRHLYELSFNQADPEVLGEWLRDSTRSRKEKKPRRTERH